MISSALTSIVTMIIILSIYHLTQGKFRTKQNSILFMIGFLILCIPVNVMNLLIPLRTITYDVWLIGFLLALLIYVIRRFEKFGLVEKCAAFLYLDIKKETEYVNLFAVFCNVIRTLCLFIYWFNPLVWIAVRLFGQSIEELWKNSGNGSAESTYQISSDFVSAELMEPSPAGISSKTFKKIKKTSLTTAIAIAAIIVSAGTYIGTNHYFGVVEEFQLIRLLAGGNWDNTDFNATGSFYHMYAEEIGEFRGKFKILSGNKLEFYNYYKTYEDGSYSHSWDESDEPTTITLERQILTYEFLSFHELKVTYPDGDTYIWECEPYLNWEKTDN